MGLKRFAAVLLVLVFSLLIAAMPIALARSVGPEEAQAPTAPCHVPADRPLIATALADGSCDPILINGGRFHETVVVARDVTIEGAQNATTIVDGDGHGAVFAVDPGVSLTMRRLRVTDGSEGGIKADIDTTLILSDVVVMENRSSGNGGGISSRGVMTLTNSTVRDNVADNNGGGIAFGSSAGTLALINSEVISNRGVRGGGLYNGTAGTVLGYLSNFTENTAAVDGGAIYNEAGGAVMLRDGVLYDNRALSWGGGVSNHGFLAITTGTILSNTAQGSGGGIENSAGTVALDNSMMQENLAGDRGGAVFNVDGVVTVTRSTLTGNGAAHGGGFFQLAFSAPGPSHIENSTLSANTAITSGGGIFVENGALLVTNGTIFGNGAATGGGIFRNDMEGMPGSVTASNTIVAGSTAGGDCAGSVGSNGYNLAGDGTCTGFTQPGDVTNRNAGVGPLQNNGGETLTHATQLGSPAVDGGSCVRPVDQRGVARPVGETCDIGAFENERPFARWLPVVILRE